MVPVRDFLNKIKWDKRLNPKDFSLMYFDRVLNTEIEVRYMDIEIDDGFMKVDDSNIPLHRIIKIKKNGKIVWERRLR